MGGEVEKKSKSYQESKQDKSEEGFFSFGTMVSGSLIKILYIIGILLITISGFILMSQDDDLVLLGLILIVVGNLFWRIICEGLIVIFSLHETSVSILKELKRK